MAERVEFKNGGASSERKKLLGFIPLPTGHEMLMMGIGAASLAFLAAMA